VKRLYEYATRDMTVLALEVERGPTRGDQRLEVHTGRYGAKLTYAEAVDLRDALTKALAVMQPTDSRAAREEAARAARAEAERAAQTRFKTMLDEAIAGE